MRLERISYSGNLACFLSLGRGWAAPVFIPCHQDLLPGQESMRVSMLEQMAQPGHPLSTDFPDPR